MNDKKRLLISLALGLDESHHMREGLTGNALDGLLDVAQISKDELFDGIDMGETQENFFKYKEAWQRFPDIVQMYAEQGTPVTPEDLQKSRPGETTLLEMAVESEAVEYLFVPEVWKDRLDDLEETFYSIAKTKRNDLDIVDIKRKVAELSGETIREDQLKEMGVEVSEITDALKSGDLDKVNDKLKAQGGELQLTDVLFVDADGDTPFYNNATFNLTRFKDMMEFFIKEGQHPGKEFFEFSRGGRPSVLQNVIKHDAFTQVFDAEFWAGRPQDMMDIYDNVPTGKREKFEITPVLIKVLEQMYATKIAEGEIDISLEELVEPVDVIKFTNDEGEREAYPVVVLGLEAAWENIEEIRQVLDSRGESLTTAHLMMESGVPKQNIFSIAIQAGKFDEAFDVVKNDTGISADLLLQKNEKGKTTLDHIIEKGKIEEIFDEKLWVGKAGDMAKVYEALPENQKDKLSTMLSHVNIRSLRAAFTQGGAETMAVFHGQAADQPQFRP